VPVVWQYTPSRPFLILRDTVRDTVFPSGAVFRLRIAEVSPCRKIQNRESDHMEEHLLICEDCQDRLESTDEFVATMKAAAGKIRESGEGESSPR
jgi:hypothetical protein